MQPGVLRALEFDRIVEAVRAFALTPMGDERLARLDAVDRSAEVAQLLAATTETATYISKHGLFPLRASTELPQILAALAVQGRALEAARLLSLASFLESVDETRTAIRQVAASFSILDRASAAAASFKNGDRARPRARSTRRAKSSTTRVRS